MTSTTSSTRRRALVLSAWVLSIIAIGACQDRPDIVSPQPTSGRYSTNASGQWAVLSEVTRSLALALNDGRLRAELGKAMKETGVTYEQKLDLSSFLRSKEAAGLLASASGRLQRSHTSLLAMVDSLPPLELYMPVKSHRNKWKGEDVYVGAQVREGDPIAAYDKDGRFVALTEKEPPSTPTFFLVGSETDFSPAARVSARGRLRRPDAACQEGGILCTRGSSNPAGTIAGKAAAKSAVPTSAPYGLYLTYSNILDLSEPYLRGDPEIEAFVTGPRLYDSTYYQRPLACAGQNESAPYYFDQNDHIWNGYVLLMSEDSLQAHGFLSDTNRLATVQMWEDDNQSCVIHEKSSFDNEGLIMSIAGEGWGVWRLKRPTNGLWSWAALAYVATAFVTNFIDAVDGDDDFLGIAASRQQTLVIVANAEQTLVLDTLRNYDGSAHYTNGGINLTYHGEYQPSGVPDGAYLTMTGPNSLGVGEQGTWSVSITNGAAPYDYAWSGLVSGTSSSTSENIYADGWVIVDVTDSTGAIFHGERYVDVPNCGEYGQDPCTRKAKRPPPGTPAPLPQRRKPTADLPLLSRGPEPLLPLQYGLSLK